MVVVTRNAPDFADADVEVIDPWARWDGASKAVTWVDAGRIYQPVPVSG